jgi:fumarate reductase flavoprotein subunit
MGEATGVLADMDGKRVQVNAKTVIIASGGFGGNPELLKNNPLWSDKLTISGLETNTGDGVEMAAEVGAAMDGSGTVLLSIHSYKSVRDFDALFFVVRAPQTIWLNKRGQRFCPEWHTDHAFAVFRQPDQFLYTVFDETMKNKFKAEGSGHWFADMAGMPIENLDGLLEAGNAKGDIKIANSWAEMAEWMGVPAERLEAEVAEYNAACDAGHDSVFNKDRRYLYRIDTPPFYAITARQDYHTAVGIIKINENMEVVNENDDPIGGLYAGGDTASGWTGDIYPIIISGSATAFAVNSGRIAGANAADYIQGK